MLVLDEKPEHHVSIEAIIQNRRFSGAAAHRVKWIVEFSYPVDSKKNPMIQLSDLVVLCVRRFLECELGYKPNMPEVVKNFYAECFTRITARTKAKKIIERTGKVCAPKFVPTGGAGKACGSVAAQVRICHLSSGREWLTLYCSGCDGSLGLFKCVE